MLKATVKIEKQMFPKYNAKVYDGDFAILKAYVTSVKEGELHPTAKDKYGCISIKGNVCEFDWFEEYEVILREDEQHHLRLSQQGAGPAGQPHQRRLLHGGSLQRWAAEQQAVASDLKSRGTGTGAGVG